MRLAQVPPPAARTGIRAALFLARPAISFFTGHSIITLKSGEKLFGTDTGTLDLPPGDGRFASLITFTGGIGAMANATGQIRLRGELDAVSGTTSGDYIGTVCRPQ